jgi:hypothetical protein
MSVIQKGVLRYLDVAMKLFILSLEDKAVDWFTSLSNNDVSVIPDF